MSEDKRAATGEKGGADVKTQDFVNVTHSSQCFCCSAIRNIIGQWWGARGEARGRTP
jgi:hypothetical protein